jgi:eukaryotic-like serine/threonine-protein kinase
MSDTVIAGRYRLVELLGRGGMSEVWRAEDLELGRNVAIKLVAPDADAARFEREARAVASLAHPNITQLYDYGEEEGRLYMVLEYMPGGTLEARLRGGRPMPDDETLAIAAGIAAGLAHAHARGVVHRDLKPANVLFDEEGRPKIADFGIARMAAGEGTLTEAGTMLGTAAYISPEQAGGEPASAASDVYSFGVILYRLLTGRLPFESTDPLRLAMMHRSDEPPPITEHRRDAPAVLESTALAALAKDPHERPPDGAALLAAIGAPGVGAPTVALPPAEDATRVLPVAQPAAAEPTPAPPPPRRRSVLPLALAGLLLLAIAGGAIAYAVTRPSSTDTPATTFGTQSVTRHRTTSAATTTTAPSTSTEQTTTEPTTTSQPTTTARPTTTVAPPTTTAQPTTTIAPPTTTTAPPPTTTTTPPTTTAEAQTTTTAP